MKELLQVVAWMAGACFGVLRLFSRGLSGCLGLVCLMAALVMLPAAPETGLLLFLIGVVCIGHTGGR